MEIGLANLTRFAGWLAGWLLAAGCRLRLCLPFRPIAAGWARARRRPARLRPRAPPLGRRARAHWPLGRGARQVS